MLFSHKVLSDSLSPHGLQQAVLPASLSFTISLSLLRLMSIELVMASNHLILCHPLLLPSILPNIRVFSTDSALCITWTNYWSFTISPSNEYSRLISFRIDWLDLLAAQGTLKGLPRDFSILCAQPLGSLVFCTVSLFPVSPGPENLTFTSCSN